jgi:hypothetical protein
VRRAGIKRSSSLVLSCIATSSSCPCRSGVTHRLFGLILVCVEDDPDELLVAKAVHALELADASTRSGFSRALNGRALANTLVANYCDVDLGSRSLLRSFQSSVITGSSMPQLKTGFPRSSHICTSFWRSSWSSRAYHGKARSRLLGRQQQCGEKVSAIV